MNQRIIASLVAALLVGAAPHLAFAQGRSLIVPEAPPAAAAPQAIRPSAPAASAAQPSAQPNAKVAPQAKPSTTVAAPQDSVQQKTAASRVSNAIATAREQALPSAGAASSTTGKSALPAVSTTTSATTASAAAAGVVAPPSAKPAPKSTEASAAAVAAPPAPKPPPSTVPTVQKKADGSQVFRVPVTPAMLQEEQRVAATTQPPAVAVGPSTAPPPASPHVAQGMQQPSALASFLGTSTTGLPKWATEGVSKTNGKTRLVVSQGVTEMVTIARNFPNRFITPFEAAEVVTTDENLAHDGVAGAVILSTASDKPIGIFIQDRYSDRSIGLVLMPEDVPQRELRLVLDETWTAPVLRPNPDQSQAQMPSAQNDFVEFLKSTLRAMAKGEVPDGHALTPMDPELVPRCQVPGLAMKPAQMLDGPTTRIAVYVASNTTAGPIPFQEAGCYRKGVLAVSAFPRPVLEPGQSTEVYVVLRKEVTTQTTTGKRRPVLVTQ